MAHILIEKTTIEILEMLCNRGGFDDWWENIDRDTAIEITKEIDKIIEQNII